MAEGFDDLEMDDFDTSKLEDLGGGRYDKTLGEIDELYDEFGDDEDTPEFVRVKYRELNGRLKAINDEIKKSRKDKREKSRSRKDKRETPLFDDSSDYKEADLKVLRVDGKKDNLFEFVNDYVDSSGKVNRGVTDNQRAIISRFLKSYLSISDGDGVRPLLNNRYNHELQKDTTFGRGGNNRDGTLTTFLNYRGVDVREVNINTGVTGRLNRNSKEEKQFTALVKKILNYNSEVIKKVSRKTKRSPVAVPEMVDNDDTIAESIERGVGGESVEQISWGTGIGLELVKKVVEKREDSVEQISKETKVPPEKVEKIIEKRKDSINQISEVAGVPFEKVEEIIEGKYDSVKQISEETGVPPEKVKVIEKEESDSIKQISRVTGVRPEQVKYVVKKDSDSIKQISEETKVPPEKVNEIVKKRPRFIEITDDVIKIIQEGRARDLKLERPKEPGGPDLEGERLRALRKQIEKIPNDLRGRKYPPIVLPKIGDRWDNRQQCF